MREIGREEDLEKINRIALKMACEVAKEKNLLFVGGICSTKINVSKETEETVRATFEE